MLLNLVLLVLAGLAAWRLRAEYQAATRHEYEFLHAHIPPAPPPPYIPLQPPAPLTPVQYIDIASKDLFSKDRNPTVVIEKQPEPVKPPMPAFPIVRGVLNIGGITAIMSENAKTLPKEVHVGDKVGEFTLVAINTQDLVLDWNGEQVTKGINELMDHSIPEPVAAPPAGPAVDSGKAPPAQIGQKTGPGADIGSGRKLCVPGDPTPPGTVVDGLKMVKTVTPFGEACTWEPAK